MGNDSKPKLLVIDDDPNFAEIYKVSLSREFDVQVARDGDEGIGMLSRAKPSAVLLDLGMPKVSGEEVLAYMQTWPQMRGIPVIVITGRRLDARRKRTLRRLANVYRSFDKSVPLRRISDEAKRLVLMGRLYHDTPKLMKGIEKAAEGRQQPQDG